MISSVLVLLSLAIAGGEDAGTASADAFATWTRVGEEGAMGDLAPIGFDLEPGQRVDERSLADATRIQPLLDGALAQVREGLSAPSCRWNVEASFIQPVRLAKAVRARAVLGASRGEPVDGMARDLLSMGRRLARCERAPLIGFAIGAVVERVGFSLIGWGASVGVWDEATVGELKQALSRAPLGVADIEAALRNEVAFSRELLPAQTPNRTVYDRSATVELLGATVERVVAMARSAEPDFDALEKTFAGMVDAREVKWLAALQDASIGPITLEKIATLGHPPGRKKNVVGRYLVAMIARGIASQADRVRRDLEANTTAATSLAHVAPQADPSTWIDRAPDAGEVGVGATEGPSELSSNERCESLGEGLYRLDATAAAKLNRDGTEPLSRAVRFIPAFEGEHVVGMKVFGFGEPSFPSSCGFASGDLILSINGVQLDGPDKALEVFARVKEAGKAIFRIRRGAGEKTITVSGRDSR